MSPEKDTGPARRIADDLRGDISAGRLGPGIKLPAIRDLAERYGVSRNTAAKAIANLRAEGLITTRYGSGAYVREEHPIRRLGPDRYARHRWQITTVEAYADEQPTSAAAQQQGHQTQEVARVPADERTAEALGVEVGTEVYERARVMTRDGSPTHTMTSYYRVEDVEGTPLVDPRPGIAGNSGGFGILTERGLPPEEITEDLRARMPTAEEALLLDLPSGEPVVELHRITRTASGRVIEYARGIHAASRFVWSYTFPIPD
ncbi:GntR family transcriptional regulator [Nonomuraea sp. NPDC050202]|uniref:GntR family transcriptional regulator n=1 Tax=Nonomuraea sp. NPDC050202 TaxID=3155035 RepID=UPI003410A4A4